MSHNSNEIEEIGLDIDNSLMLQLLEAHFVRTLPQSIIRSFLNDIGEITEDKEKDQEVTDKIIIVAGRMLFNEIVYKAVQQALETKKDGDSVPQESNTSS